MAFALTPERVSTAERLISQYPTRRAALLPLLWLCQEQHGHLDDEVVAFVADRLELSTAAVKGVITFYTMFFDRPVGKHVIWVCRTIACEARGGKTLQEHLEKRLGCHAGETTADGRFTLLRAECLAACGQAPMVQIDDAYFENLDLAKLDAVLDAYERGNPPEGSL